MRFWIKKENDQDPLVNWKDAYVFSINRDTGSTLYSSLPTVWYHLNQMVLNPLYEDLYIIALSAFGIDKRVSRRLFDDCWTRDISVSIPVLEYDSWKKTESRLFQSLCKLIIADIRYVNSSVAGQSF